MVTVAHVSMSATFKAAYCAAKRRGDVSGAEALKQAYEAERAREEAYRPQTGAGERT